MSRFFSLPILGDLLGRIAGALTKGKEAMLEAQSRINEAEVAGAPVSRLRLWRSFLGWALALALVWELLGRPALLTYWPRAELPPSMLGEVRNLILAMLGLGL